MSVLDLASELQDRVVASARAREPGAIGIAVHGSYALGTARIDSDLDLDIFLGTAPVVHYRTWFEARGDDLPLHVSARSDLTLETWGRETAEPEEWAFGLPVELIYVWLWVGDAELKARLGERSTVVKAGAPPEVEDMVDAVIKVRACADRGDELGLRLAAQAVARCAAPCVAALNDAPRVHDPRSALDVLLHLPVVPDGWYSDIPACLGLVPLAGHEIFDAVERTGLGVLRLLRAVDPSVDTQPDVARYLRDGTFERLLSRRRQ
jgi:predicted nucleotidyltransferase